MAGPSSEKVIGGALCNEERLRRIGALADIPFGDYGSMLLPFVSNIPIPTRTPERTRMFVVSTPAGIPTPRLSSPTQTPASSAISPPIPSVTPTTSVIPAGSTPNPRQEEVESVRASSSVEGGGVYRPVLRSMPPDRGCLAARSRIAQRFQEFGYSTSFN